jgi:hypothetical protein
MSKLILLLAAAGLTHTYTDTDASQFMMKSIDPLVMFGEYKSHMHSFFGSATVDRDPPTSNELRVGCSVARSMRDDFLSCIIHSSQRYIYCLCIFGL